MIKVVRKSYSTFVKLEKMDKIATIKLNNPAKRNSLCSQMIKELTETITSLDETTKLVLLKSTGNVFCSGYNLKELSEFDSKNQRNYFKSSFDLFKKIKNLKQPVIAEIDGVVAAAGVHLVSSCDLIVCSEESTFATSGVKFGVFCHSPGVALFRNMSSEKKVKEMLLTGEPMNATEALQFGFINRVASKENLEKETEKLVKSILHNSSEIVCFGKGIFQKQIEMTEDEAINFTLDAMMENMELNDSKEGMKAFKEKRKPQWKE
eukprot:gene6643-10808_t